jgi:hypothetical protein
MVVKRAQRKQSHVKSHGRYTCRVRVYVASILAFFLVTIACADPLCCADGCDRGGMAATQAAQTGADCPTCLSALVPRHAPPIVRSEISTEMGEMTVSPLISPFLADVDHPPRLV